MPISACLTGEKVLNAAVTFVGCVWQKAQQHTTEPVPTGEPAVVERANFMPAVLELRVMYSISLQCLFAQALTCYHCRRDASLQLHLTL